MFQQGDYENAEKCGELVKHTDGYNSAGFVNLGACAMARGNLEQAKNYFISALDCDPSSFEALYNLGKDDCIFCKIFLLFCIRRFGFKTTRKL